MPWKAAVLVFRNGQRRRPTWKSWPLVGTKSPQGGTQNYQPVAYPGAECLARNRCDSEGRIPVRWHRAGSSRLQSRIWQQLHRKTDLVDQPGTTGRSLSTAPNNKERTAKG